MGRPVTIAVPTYGRERVLIETLDHLLALTVPADEILVADQTPEHEEATARRLEALDARGAIRWLRLPEPSIPGSMNTALREARSPVVLFVDDDIVPDPDLVRAHAAAYEDDATWAVTGMVLQPGEEPLEEAPPWTEDGLRASLDFSFRSPERAEVRSVMAGNLSVRRERALAAGGFDENFVGVAYRFETEFARRIRDHGGRVLYEPAARIRHLRARRGGTRRFGSHLCSASPAHGVGDYYFALRRGPWPQSLAYMAARPFREVTTRHHLTHPWCIPVKLVGEIGGLCWAARLALRGPATLNDRDEAT